MKQLQWFQPLNKCHLIHGMTWKWIYKTWKHLKQRCNNKNNKDYHNYWWRWISYDPKRDKFEWFYEDMWNTYKEWLSIDRIDNNWNYCKDNCRWATNKEQANNRWNNLLLEYNWLSLWLHERWNKLWIKRSLLAQRYYVYKRPIEKVLFYKMK